MPEEQAQEQAQQEQVQQTEQVEKKQDSVADPEKNEQLPPELEDLITKTKNTAHNEAKANYLKELERKTGIQGISTDQIIDIAEQYKEWQQKQKLEKMTAQEREYAKQIEELKRTNDELSRQQREKDITDNVKNLLMENGIRPGNKVMEAALALVRVKYIKDMSIDENTGQLMIDNFSDKDHLIRTLKDDYPIFFSDNTPQLTTSNNRYGKPTGNANNPYKAVKHPWEGGIAAKLKAKKG